MAQVGSLYTSLTLESSSFISGLKKSADAAERQSRVMERSFNVAKNAFAGFIGGLSVGAVVAAGKRALDYAGSLGEVAQQLGISTDALQQYQYMAGQAGVSQEEMRKAVGRLTKTLGEAKIGSDGAERAFAAIGIRGKELAGLNTEQAMKKIADALATIPDPAKRAALEVEFFGKAGQKLDTVLAGGSAAIDELASAADRLGIVLSSEQIQKADETADKLEAIKTVLEARIAGVVADNAGSIMKLADAVGTLSEQASRMSPKQWALIGGAALAGAAAGQVAIPIPFVGAAIGGIAAGGAAFTRANDYNERLSAVMPGQQRNGVRYDPKTGKFIGLGGSNQPGTPSLDLGALNRKAPRAGKAVRDPFAEWMKDYKPGADLEIFRADANIDDPILNGQAIKNVEALGKQLDKAAEAWDLKMNSPDAVAASEKRIADMEELNRVSSRFAEDLTSGIGQAIIYGESLGKSLIRSIKAASAELIASGLLDLLMGKTGANGTRSGGILQAGIAAVSAVFTPRAMGGPVSGGSPYLVGERGPEMFMPGRSGTIIPSGAMRGMGGGGGIIVHQTIAPNFAGNAATREDVAMMGQMARQSAIAGVRDAMSRRGGWR